MVLCLLPPIQPLVIFLTQPWTDFFSCHSLSYSSLHCDLGTATIGCAWGCTRGCGFPANTPRSCDCEGASKVILAEGMSLDGSSRSVVPGWGGGTRGGAWHTEVSDWSVVHLLMVLNCCGLCWGTAKALWLIISVWLNLQAGLGAQLTVRGRQHKLSHPSSTDRPVQ